MRPMSKAELRARHDLACAARKLAAYLRTYPDPGGEGGACEAAAAQLDTAVVAAIDHANEMQEQATA